MDLAKLKDQPEEMILEVFRTIYLKKNRDKYPNFTDLKILNQPISVDGVFAVMVDMTKIISKQQSEINELRNEITRIRIAI